MLLNGDPIANSSEAHNHPGQFLRHHISQHVALLHKVMAGVDGTFVVMAIREDPNTGIREKPIVRHFQSGAVAEMENFIFSFEYAPHTNVYCTWSLFRSDLEAGSKGSERDVVAAQALIVDMDADTGNFSPCPIEPSYVLETSPGNYQAIFILGQPLSPQHLKQLAERYATHTKCDHGTKDIAHVWRIPGTLNWPNKKKRERGRSPEPFVVTVVKPFAGNFTNANDLWAATEPICKTADGNKNANAEAETVGAENRCPEPIEGLLARCSELRRVQLSQSGAPDRSRHLYNLIGLLKGDGFSKEEIYTLIWGHPGGAGHKAHEQGDKWLREEVERSWQKTGDVPPEKPRPLRRELPPPTPFPVAQLGETLGRAVDAILDKVQCPPAIAAQSVLGAASLAVQGHADVVVPATGQAKPTSLFMATVAASGERKSAADHEALRPVRQRERELAEQDGAAQTNYANQMIAWQSAREKRKKEGKGHYQATLDALNALGPEPAAPLTPILTCSEPTFEGLCRMYIHGLPSVGIFSDEGGQFVGGHGLSPDNKLRTAAGLSSLWDGKPIKRVRVADGAAVLPGRRLAIHLMVQPDVASELLGDALLKDQGFLSRLLVSAPASTAGTRFQKNPRAESEMALRAYTARLLEILRRPLPLAPDKQNQLQPRRLHFDPEARALWAQYADHVERRLAPGNVLEPIRGLANKLPEHAARISGVLTLVDDIDAQLIGCDVLYRATLIAEHYASEALRLFEAEMVGSDIRLAETLLHWLQTKWTEPFIGLQVIYQYGPNRIRTAAVAKKAITILEEHGWVEKAAPGTVVSGAQVKEAWRIVRRSS